MLAQVVILNKLLIIIIFVVLEYLLVKLFVLLPFDVTESRGLPLIYRDRAESTEVLWSSLLLGQLKGSRSHGFLFSEMLGHMNLYVSSEEKLSQFSRLQGRRLVILGI